MCLRRLPFIIRLLLWILIPVLIIIGVLYGAVVYINKTYDIDVFQVIRDVRALGQTVDENVIAPNRFTENDIKELKEETDVSLPGLITIDENGDYNVTPEKVNSLMNREIKFTDKQVALIVNKNLKSVISENAEAEGKIIPEILQVEFSNIKNGNVDFNVVVKVSLLSFKDKMNSFPYSIVRGLVPDNLYISATVKVEKGSAEFDYTTSPMGIKINNFDETRTKNFLSVLKKIDPTFDSTELNLTLVNPFVDGMIGKEGKPGMAYSLKEAGAKDYNFIAENNKNYFIVEREDIVLP